MVVYILVERKNLLVIIGDVVRRRKQHSCCARFLGSVRQFDDIHDGVVIDSGQYRHVIRFCAHCANDTLAFLQAHGAAFTHGASHHKKTIFFGDAALFHLPHVVADGIVIHSQFLGERSKHQRAHTMKHLLLLLSIHETTSLECF